MTERAGWVSGLREHIGGLLLPVAILVVIAVFFVETLDYPEGEDVGPAVVPRLWMAFATLFSVVLIVQELRRKGGGAVVNGHLWQVFLAVGWLAAYLVAIETIGYFVSTFAFLTGGMIALGVRSRILIGSVSLGWLVFCYVIFYKMLYIPLPVGPLLGWLL